LLVATAGRLKIRCQLNSYVECVSKLEGEGADTNVAMTKRKNIYLRQQKFLENQLHQQKKREGEFTSFE